MIGEKKVSGIIIEQEEDYKIVGIGINFNQAPEIKDGGRPSGCLKEFATQLPSIVCLFLFTYILFIM